MSASVGPIFIHDADGVPLMPLAAPHARKLMSQGKALALTHQYPFSVLRLKRRVHHPVLQPLLLAVALHGTTAQCFVLAQAARKVLPLLSVLVDIAPDDVAQHHTTLHFPHPTELPQLVPVLDQKLREPYTFALNSVIATAHTLCGLLPISHMIVDNTERAWDWHLWSLLIQGLRGLGPQYAVAVDPQLAQAVPSSLLQALAQFRSEPTRHALAVATRLPARPHVATVQHVSRRGHVERRASPSAFDILAAQVDPSTVATLQPGMLCNVDTEAGEQLGILLSHDSATQQTTLRRLVSATLHGVVWQSIQSHTSKLHMLNANPVVFVPVAPAAQAQQIAPLGDNVPDVFTL